MKRNRLDGQLNKEEYESASEVTADSPNVFVKATPNTMAQRRIVTVTHHAKKKEFVRHIKALNVSFHDWFVEQCKNDPYANLAEAAQDYIDYADQLEDRYLRKHGEVLTFGSGDCGQLAHGVDRDEDLMVRFPRIVYSLRDKKVCGIACGGLHNAVYTEQGLVYSWGCADDGSLGREGDESIPLLVEGLANEVIVGIACGDGQTMAISTKGKVWGWGCYKDKEGKKFFNASSTSPNPKKDIKRQQNTPQLIDGAVYSWGLGECGELGRIVPPLKHKVGDDLEYDAEGIHNYHLQPGSMIHADTQSIVCDAKTIGCGAYHSLLVIGGSVYSCGLNNYAQLGQGDVEPYDCVHEIKALDGKKVCCVKGGVHHSLVLTSSGTMYAFGRGDSGQLGITSIDNAAGAYSTEPQSPVLSLEPGHKITAIACGGNHNLALTNKGEIYSWGFGDMLALGHGEYKDEVVPKKLNFSKANIGSIFVTQVAGGGQHSVILGQVITTK